MGLFAFTQASDIDGDYTNEFVATIRGGEGELKEVLTHLEKRSAVSIINTVSIWIFYGYGVIQLAFIKRAASVVLLPALSLLFYTLAYHHHRYKRIELSLRG